MKTREELEDLKNMWQRDPCWDIEAAEGFEEYRDELIQYRLSKEEEWENKYKELVLSFANTLGLSKHSKLAFYLFHEKDLIEKLEKRIAELENKVY